MGNHHGNSRDHDNQSDIHANHSHSSHEHSLSQELMCHLPYATFSVAISFVVLSILHFMGMGLSAQSRVMESGYHLLFHAFHYLHLVFATVGTFVTFSRFSADRVRAIWISLVGPIIFCTLSDVALPAIAGKLLGVSMHIHICFFSLPDFMNVAPFLVVGLITGFAMSKHHESSLGFVSLASHFVHILISSLAAVFYVASHGFNAWHSLMGLLFFMLVVAVVVPCTISDVVVPLYFARGKRK